MPQSSFSAKLPPKKPHNMTRRSREYLTAEEVDLLIRTARRQGRYGQRNATLILLMYRHALRVAEVVRLQWDMLDLKAALVHVRRVKNGVAALHRTRTLDERMAIAQCFAADLLPGLADGRPRPLIDRVFPLREAMAAQAYLASNAQIGKIVLTV